MRIIQITAFLLAAIGPAFGEELKVDQTKPRSVKFLAKTQIEIFEGITDQIEGYVSWSGDDMLSNSEISFDVDLNSFDTRIKLRNRHMREKHLETDKYPLAQYRGKLVHVEEIEPNELTVAAEGKMKIHGVERGLATEATVTIEENSYHLQCDIQIKLTDYKIKIPKFLLLKVDDGIRLVLDFYLRPVEGDDSMMKLEG